MNRYLAAIILAIGILAGALPVSAESENPFAQKNWVEVLQNDPGLHENPTSVQSGYHFFETTKNGQGGMFLDQKYVVTGQVNGEWVAAVPLDGGGSSGAFIGLIYTEKSLNHFVTIANAPNGHIGFLIDKRGLILIFPHYEMGICNACATQWEEHIFSYDDGKFKNIGNDLITIPKQPTIATPSIKNFHNTITPISSYQDLKTWFDEQPGARISNWNLPHHKPRPKNAEKETLDAVETAMKSYRGNAGGGGIGGYYDKTNGNAMILVRHDTALEIILARTKTAPGSLPMMYLPDSIGTRHNAKLGMTATEIEKIEGPAKHLENENDKVLNYEWDGKMYGNLAQVLHLRFLIHDGKCIAINYGSAI